MGTYLNSKQLTLRQFMVVVVLIIMASAFGAGLAQWGHDHVVGRIGQAELRKLSEGLVRRTEYATDFAILTGFDVQNLTVDPCSPAGKSQLQRIVFSRGVVKDIRIVGPNNVMRCSAFPATVQNSIGPQVIDIGVPARNTDYAMQDISVAGRPILGISWTGGAHHVQVIIDMQSQLFDAFPESIRDDSFGKLSVKGRGSIGTFGTPSDAQVIKASAESSRYPIRAELEIDAAAFATWHSNYAVPAKLLGGLIGLVLGTFAFREWSRPVEPKKELLSALKRGEIQPFYQATFDLQTRAITGCEILMRRITPDGKVVPPSQFIPIAEATGAIIPMTRLVLRQALADLKSVTKQNRQFRIAVNIVPCDFCGDGFEREMLQITKEAGLATRQLTLEITERNSECDGLALINAAKRARDLGFKVALDDVGTGHNGLSHLQDIGIDTLKIDKKFTDFASAPGPAQAIIESLVNLADRLKIHTLAEGIETEDQRQALLKMGVKSGQGYLVGKPMPAQDFIRSLARPEHLQSASHQRAA